MATIPKVQAASANAQANASCTKSCNMCEKDGLLILPVRYAAAAATGAHGLTAATGMALPKGEFGAGVTTVSAQKASYFLRSIRKGFIHVYYPSQHKWQIYGVTSEGYVFNYPLDSDLPDTQEKAFNCQQTGHKELARCISIDKSKTAGTVYLAFSDVRWTAAVRKRYEANEKGCRDKRMQSFDALAWSSGHHSQKHVHKISDLSNYVLEYKGGTAAATTASPFKFKDLSKEAPNLVTVTDVHDKGDGAFFALWDSAGITQELNAEYVAGMGAAMYPYKRGMWTVSSIDGLQLSVEHSAEEDEDNAAEQMKAQAAENYAIYSLFDGGKRYQQEANTIDQQEDSEMDTVKAKAWDKYKEYYSDKAVTTFRKNMNDAIKKAEDSTLTPLGEDHAKWLTGSALATVFAWDYHEQDPVKGVAYVELFHRCIAGSADRKAVFDAVIAWANGSAKDRDNMLLRSFVLNHDPVAEKVAEAAGTPLVEMREPLAKLIELNNTTNQILEKEGPGMLLRADKAVGRIIHELLGPIANFIAKGVDSATTRVLTASLCTRQKVEFIYKPVEGTPNQWISFMARQIWEKMPPKNRPTMKALKSGLRKTFTQTDSKVVKVPQYILLDANEAARLASSATSGVDKATAILAPGARAVLTEENVGDVFIPKFNKFSQGEFGYGLIGACFTVVNWLIARKELKEASALNQKEMETKLDASIVSIGASLVQEAGNGLKAYGEMGVKALSAEVAESIGPYVEFAGRFVGAIAGLVGAIYDFKEAKENYEHKNLGLAYLYASSVVANVAFAIATILGATVFIFIFMIIVMVIGLIILWKKKDKIGEWLEKCFFGTGDPKFSESDEHKQFELLTQG